MLNYPPWYKCVRYKYRPLNPVLLSLRLKGVLKQISDNVRYNVWYEITYPFPNFNGYIDEVWEWVRNSSDILLAPWLLIHIGMKVNSF